MSWKQKIEDHPLVFFFSILVTGFCAGVGAYHSLLSIATLEPIQKNSYVLKEAIKDNYVSREKYIELAAQLKKGNQNLEKNLELNYVDKTKYDSLAKQLKIYSHELSVLRANLDSVTKKLMVERRQFDQEKKMAEKREEELTKRIAQEEWKVKLRATEAQERIEYIRACVVPDQVTSSLHGSSRFPGTSASQCANEYDKMKQSGSMNILREEK